MTSYCALRNTNIIFPRIFFYYFMYLQFKIWLIRKIRLTDTQYLYIVNITTKIPNFNTEYQAMSQKYRKVLSLKIQNFQTVCRVPRESTRRSILFAVCQGVAHGELACLPCAPCGTRQSWASSTSAAPPSTSVRQLRTWVARARSLPCALTVAHGKDCNMPCVLFLPWVPCIGARQIGNFAVCVVFAVCFILGSRQSVCLPCARILAHDKLFGTRHITHFR